MAELRQRAKAGGATTKRRHGEEHYERIATLGGQATLERYGPAFYAEIARLGWARRREQAAR